MSAASMTDVDPETEAIIAEDVFRRRREYERDGMARLAKRLAPHIAPDALRELANVAPGIGSDVLTSLAAAARRELERRGEAIPDPDPLRDQDREGTPEPLQIWERAEPKPRSYVVDGLIPQDAITSLYGDGGSGKSLLVLYLGTCVTLGQAFLDRSVVSGPVLYVDAELDADEFTRRAYRVARGMGRDRPPTDLYYYRLAGSLYDPQNVALVQGMVDEIAPALVVLDSVMAASYGADLERANDTTLTMKAIERWGTVLGIDHIAKPMPGANLSQYRQYGSVFKFNLSRSVLQVIQADGGGLTLRQTKHNFGPKAEPLLIGMDFEEDRVSFARLNPDDDRLSGIEDNLPAVERVLRELNFHPEGVLPADLADALGIAEKTVRNHLTTLKQRMRAASDEHGRWFPIPDPYRSQEPGTHAGNGGKP